MFKRKADIIFLIIIAGLFWLISFPLNDWFSETMPRHQVLQLPTMMILGVLSGWRFSSKICPEVSWSVAIYIFVMASLIFWMLPHSVDIAVINPFFNRVMHLNMFAAGLFFIPAMRGVILELKILFLGMIAAMIIAVGYTLINYDILLCSAFDIVQQRETGNRLIIIGLVLFVLNLFIFFKGLGKS